MTRTILGLLFLAACSVGDLVTCPRRLSDSQTSYLMQPLP